MLNKDKIMFDLMDVPGKLASMIGGIKYKLSIQKLIIPSEIISFCNNVNTDIAYYYK